MKAAEPARDPLAFGGRNVWAVWLVSGGDDSEGVEAGRDRLIPDP